MQEHRGSRRTFLAASLLAGILTSLPAQGRAGTLESIAARGYFTWGGDLEGGGPFVYPDEKDPNVLTGFEVDLADLIAGVLSEQLGKPLTAKFVQGQWDALPSLLQTERVDLVLNGYEWTAERMQVMDSTIPYYVYELQLLAREGDARISGWESLKSGGRYKIGVLGGSAAETYVRERFSPEQVEVVLYDGNTNAMSETVAGKLDATLQDLPIAIFYRPEFQSLRFVGEPVEPGRYVILVRKGDDGLRDALSSAIETLRTRGALRAVYERYGIWTEAQNDPRLLQLPAIAGREEAGTVGAFVRRYGPLLVESAGMTVLLSVASFPLAIALGLLIALGRLYGPRLLAAPLSVYVEVIRGTPLMLQLFVIFYLLPAIGINVDAIPAAIMGLAINYSAYEAEIYRAGFQAVPVGQMEAALTLGMSRGLALRRIIVPQAVRVVVPPVTNDFIALFKDTSVCSVITVVELSKRYNISVMNNPSDILPLAAVTALLYLCMSYPLSVLSAKAERELRR